MIVHGIEVGLDALAFALGFLFVVVPVLFIGYALWGLRWSMRLQWRRLVAWRAWRQTRRLRIESDVSP